MDIELEFAESAVSKQKMVVSTARAADIRTEQCEIKEAR